MNSQSESWSAMHELIEQDLHFGNRQDKSDNSIALHSGLTLPIKSQIRLKELYDYVDASRKALRDIRMDFALLEPDPDCPASLRASERLQKFYLEAANWRFDSLYEISRSLQILVIESRGRVWGDDLGKVLNDGIEMLSTLLEQCESEFQLELAIADMLDRINRVSWN